MRSFFTVPFTASLLLAGLSFSAMPALAAPPAYTLQVLNPLPGNSSSEGRSVNSLGQVTGASFLGSASIQAFFGNPATGTVRGLGTLGGSESIGYAVNTLGQVTGSASTLR